MGAVPSVRIIIFFAKNFKCEAAVYSINAGKLATFSIVLSSSGHLIAGKLHFLHVNFLSSSSLLNFAMEADSVKIRFPFPKMPMNIISVHTLIKTTLSILHQLDSISSICKSYMYTIHMYAIL